MSAIAGLSRERAEALLAELTLVQLAELLLAKACAEKTRVDIRIRPLEHRVKVRKKGA